MIQKTLAALSMVAAIGANAGPIEPLYPPPGAAPGSVQLFPVTDEIAPWTAATPAWPVLMAGDQTGTPPDSPALRIDPNTVASPYRGVCSVRINVGPAQSICSGTPITTRHILTAAHCVDLNDNGTVDPGVSITLFFNITGSPSLTIFNSQVASVQIHPNYTGFANPSVNDDLCIITLVSDLPAAVPIYPVYRGNLAIGQEIQLVGYGGSGFGDVSESVGPSFNTKRRGRNQVGQFLGNDEGGGPIEVWRFDFDGPVGNGTFAPGTLGNAIETALVGGDSGGPGFLDVEGQLQTYSVNTFSNSANPTFGSLHGGMVVAGYLSWIDPIIGEEVQPPANFSVLMPADGATAIPVTAFLSWQSATGAVTYDIDIATDMAMTNVVYAVDDLMVTNHLVPNGELDNNTIYFWRVTATNPGGDTESTPNPAMFRTRLAGDVNGDNSVDFDDLNIILGQFGQMGGGLAGDTNGDGAVDFDDLNVVLTNFGTSI